MYRWSIQIPKRQYRDHLVGQLTRLKITCGVQNFYPLLFHLRTNLACCWLKLLANKLKRRLINHTGGVAGDSDGPLMSDVEHEHSSLDYPPPKLPHYLWRPVAPAHCSHTNHPPTLLLLLHRREYKRLRGAARHSLSLTLATTTHHHEAHFSRQESLEEIEQHDQEREEACQDGAGQLPQRVIRGGDWGEPAERAVGGKAGVAVGDGTPLPEGKPLLASLPLLLGRQRCVRLPAGPTPAWLSWAENLDRRDKRENLAGDVVRNQGGLDILRQRRFFTKVKKATRRRHLRRRQQERYKYVNYFWK